MRTHFLWTFILCGTLVVGCSKKPAENKVVVAEAPPIPAASQPAATTPAPSPAAPQPSAPAPTPASTETGPTEAELGLPIYARATLAPGSVVRYSQSVGGATHSGVRAQYTTRDSFATVVEFFKGRMPAAATMTQTEVGGKQAATWSLSEGSTVKTVTISNEGDGAIKIDLAKISQ